MLFPGSGGGGVWNGGSDTTGEATVGGAGESSHTRMGGDGGVGRVRLDADTVNGYSLGSTEALAALALACDPVPGHSALPE